jgi:CBS domain-containing protein
MTVEEVMTTDVATVELRTPLKEVARILAARGVSAVPVLNGDGSLAGIVSEADILRKEQYQDELVSRPRRRFGRGRKPRPKTGDVAAEMMSSPAVTIGPDASLVSAANVMMKSNVKRLPVVDEDGCLVGIVSRADLLRVFLRPDDEIADEIREQIFVRILLAEPGYEIDVRDGVVTLAGQVDRRSSVEICDRLVRSVDGVVDVVNRLTYRFDDSERRLLRSVR